MPFSAGPNIAARPNLVFEYDTGDVQNSYKGEPTTNLVGSPFSVTSGYATTVPTRTDNAILNWNGQNTGGLLSGTGYFAYVSAATTNGNQYTTSWYIKGGTLTTPSFSWGGAHQGNRTDFTFNTDTGAFTGVSQAAGEIYGANYLGNGWWRVYYSSTLSSGNAYYPQLNTTGIFYVGGLQIEQKNHPTPFVNGTRSNTQGLLDVSGYNTTIDLSNMSYTSTAGLLFNGSTTEMHPTTVLSYLSSSAMECVFSTATVSGLKTIFGYSQNGGYSQPTIGSMYLDSTALRASVITAAQVYRTATAAATISANTFYHVVLNKDTSGGNLQLYVNGTLSGTQTFDSVTYAQWPTPGNYIGSNLLDIGKSTNTSVGQGWSTSALSGSIPVTRIYNQILSAQQVLQNYNQLKTRFNLQ